MHWFWRAAVAVEEQTPKPPTPGATPPPHAESDFLSVTLYRKVYFMTFKNRFSFLLACVAISFASCKTIDKIEDPYGSAVRWDFASLDGWRNDSSESSPESYTLEAGRLRISARANTSDRVKVCTTDRFGPGIYSWRIYVPEMGVGDKASIGAFLYNDDTREIDFEIGYGKVALRNQLGAAEDEVVCFCTNQGNPYSSSQFVLKSEQWYTLSICLGRGDNGLTIKWFINGNKAKEMDSLVESEMKFTVHCSVENLEFIGDHPPNRDNYGLFDWVEFRPLLPQ